MAAARAAFERAQVSFDEAAGYGRSPVLRATGLVPLLGRSTDALVVLAQAGERTAAAGADLAGALADLPGGLQALAPRGGRLPVEAIASLEPAIAHARRNLEGASASVGALPTSFLLGPVAGARDQVMHELEAAVSAARAAEALTAALPALVGSNGDRSYFVGAQATAELRGTGGLIGAYSILRAVDGRLVMEPMRSIHTLPDLLAEVAPPPPAEYTEPFSRFGGPGFWRNLNMSPHAPTAAVLIESLYEEVTGEAVDGVILVDAQALAEMLEATGPLEAPTLGRTLESSTIVDYLTNEAYFEFGNEAERKRVLGAAVLAVWTRFLAGTEPVAALQALSDAAGGGHLVLHSTDPGVQLALEAAGIAGALEPPTAGNLFAVSSSNADGTKVDFYLRRELRFEVQLGAGGSATSSVRTTTTNGAPVGAEPSYVFGPFPGTGLGPGDSRAFVATYCAPACGLEDAESNGETTGVEAHEDRGLPVFTTFVRTDAGTSSSLELSFAQTAAWLGDELGGTYRVILEGQVTIRPTVATVVIAAPPGMRIVDTNVAMNLDGNTATWQGILEREQELVIRFERPFAGRVWSQLWDLLSTPILEV